MQTKIDLAALTLAPFVLPQDGNTVPEQIGTAGTSDSIPRAPPAPSALLNNAASAVAIGNAIATANHDDAMDADDDPISTLAVPHRYAGNAEGNGSVVSRASSTGRPSIPASEAGSAATHASAVGPQVFNMVVRDMSVILDHS